MYNMSQKNSEREIEEAHNKVRGEVKKPDQKLHQKKESSQEKEEQQDKKETNENSEKESLERDGQESAEEHAQEELSGQKRKEVNLEEIARSIQPLPAAAHDQGYVEQLSHQPMGEIYNQIKEIYKTVEDKGYLSPTEQRQVEYLSSAVEKKFEDEEQGTYSFSEQAARAASITQHLSASMMGSYKGKKMNEMYK